MKDFEIKEFIKDEKPTEYAVFSDGTRKKQIKIDSKYGKYFEVDNILNPSINDPMRHTYYGRIKDAVEMIRNGNGDCISQYTILGITIDRVLYFIDREIGEKLRQQFIEGWKDAKFGWAIRCGNKDSIGGLSLLNKKHEKISPLDTGGDTDPILFDSEEDATNYANCLIERARYYARILSHNLSEIQDEKRRESIIKNTLCEIEEYTHTKLSVIIDCMFDMLDRNCNLKSPTCNLDNYKFEVIQHLIKKKDVVI